jgi:hypothetical protein
MTRTGSYTVIQKVGDAGRGQPMVTIISKLLLIWSGRYIISTVLKVEEDNLSNLKV